MASGERATVVMASGMHAWGGSCMVPGGRGIAPDCCEGNDCLASPVWFMVGSSAD